MLQKFSIILTGILFFLNLFYGCASLKNEPVSKKYFDLNIKLPVSEQNSINKDDTLLVREFFINPAFDSHSLVYRVGKNEFINDYYNEFISYPATLITEKISESLFASSHFKPPLTNMKQDSFYRLSGKINRLYGDFQDTNDPKAIIEIRMILEKKDGSISKAVIRKTYLVEEPIISHTPDHLISGWNLALAKIVIFFISDYQTPTP
jgi:hypothetical protein